MRKKIRILSIDGGGIRGILPGVILQHLEQLLCDEVGKTVYLSDYFDLLAGTSTGGILTCAYLAPDPQHPNRPLFSAAEAVELYLKRGDVIFHQDFWQQIQTLGGFRDERYPVAALERALQEYFGDAKLSDMLRPCMITAYDIRNRRARFFTSSNAHLRERNFFLRDVARATSAAPTYFEPAFIHSDLGVGYALIDGGVFANNPAMCAYSEARQTDFSAYYKDDRFPSNPTAGDMVMVSIGTGSVSKPYHYHRMKDRGFIGWLNPLIDIMMSGNAETVNYQVRKMFEANGEDTAANYYRLEPSLGDAVSEMDNVDQDNLLALQQAGLAYVAEYATLLKEIAQKLVYNQVEPSEEPA